MIAAVESHGLIHALAQARLLTPEQLDEYFDVLLPQCTDWKILSQELIYREWLTPYQVREINAGRIDDLHIGSMILLEPIGEGGTGHIFLARNWKFDSRVVVKIIRNERARNHQAVNRFLREIRALGSLRHPRIVHALDADMDHRGRLYISMEFRPGIDLSELIHQQGVLSIDIACRYIAQVAEGLQYINSLGLVHRDIKPSNLLVSENGSQVKILDLGLALFERVEDDPQAIELTQKGVMIGTPDYISPEQIRHPHSADIRSDLYSLGATFYHLLTGRPPFVNRNPIDTLHQHLQEAPPAVTSFRADVPEEVVAILNKLLEKKARDRYQDPSELVLALQGYLNQSGDTVTDRMQFTQAITPLPLSNPTISRTEEIPLDLLHLYEAPVEVEPTLDRRKRSILGLWLSRYLWAASAVLLGIAVGVLIGR
jgi:serine/threonine protein kinase